MKINKILAAGMAATLAVTSLAAVGSAETASEKQRTFDMAWSEGEFVDSHSYNGYINKDYQDVAQTNLQILAFPNLAVPTLYDAESQFTFQTVAIADGTWVAPWNTWRNPDPTLTVTGIKYTDDGKEVKVTNTYTLSYRGSWEGTFKGWYLPVLPDDEPTHTDNEFASYDFDRITEMKISYTFYGKTIDEETYNNGTVLRDADGNAIFEVGSVTVYDYNVETGVLSNGKTYDTHTNSLKYLTDNFKAGGASGVTTNSAAADKANELVEKATKTVDASSLKDFTTTALSNDNTDTDAKAAAAQTEIATKGAEVVAALQTIADLSSTGDQKAIIAADGIKNPTDNDKAAAAATAAITTLNTALEKAAAGDATVLTTLNALVKTAQTESLKLQSGDLKNLDELANASDNDVDGPALDKAIAAAKKVQTALESLKTASDALLKAGANADLIALAQAAEGTTNDTAAKAYATNVTGALTDKITALASLEKPTAGWKVQTSEADATTYATAKATVADINTALGALRAAMTTDTTTSKFVEYKATTDTYKDIYAAYAAITAAITVAQDDYAAGDPKLYTYEAKAETGGDATVEGANSAAAILAYGLTNGGWVPSKGVYNHTIKKGANVTLTDKYPWLLKTDWHENNSTFKYHPDGTLQRDEIFLLSSTAAYNSWSATSGMATTTRETRGDQTYIEEGYDVGTLPRYFAGMASQVADFFNKAKTGSITFKFTAGSTSSASTWKSGGVPSTEVGLKNTLGAATENDFALFFNYHNNTGSLKAVTELDATAGTVTFKIDDVLDDLGGLTKGTIESVYYGLTKGVTSETKIKDAGYDLTGYGEGYTADAKVPGLQVKEIVFEKDAAEAATDADTDDVTDTSDDDEDDVDDTAEDDVDDTDDDWADDEDDDDEDDEDDDATLEDNDDDEDDVANAIDENVPEDDANPGTGAGLAVIPAIVAAAAVVVSKKRK